MYFKKLLLSTIIGLSIHSMPVLAENNEQNSVNSTENVVILPTVDEVRKLIALKKFDEAQSLLKKIETIPELNMKENGIFWQVQAEASFNLAMNAYTSALELVATKEAKEIVAKIDENKVQKKLEETQDILSKAQNILNVDRKKFQSDLELENNPDKDPKKIQNPAITPSIDKVAVKMLESKLFKISMMQNDLNVMQKTLKDALTQTKSVYSYYKDIAEKEAKANTTKTMKSVGLVFAGLAGLGLLFVVSNKKYTAHVAKKESEAQTKEMYGFVEKIEELFAKHRNNQQANPTVIANFKERVKQSTSLSDIKDVYQQVNTYFNSI